MTTTREEALEIARESGFYFCSSSTAQRLALIIDLVRAEENEACAKVCEESLTYQEDNPGETFATIIRARMR